MESAREYDFSTFKAPNAALMADMLEKSPISHVNAVRAPVLIALGAKDRRCPPSGGTEYYYALHSRGVKSRYNAPARPPSAPSAANSMVVAHC